jgi:hypothetical protein
MKVNKNTTVDRTKMTKVYSGTKGCCCGCNGEYYYEDNPGFPTWEDNQKEVDRIIRKVENGKGEFDDGGSYQCLEQRGHYYIVYYD